MFPARRSAATVKVRAALKLDASAVPSAGAHYPAAAIKFAFNIDRVLFIGTGDLEVFFAESMPHEHFVVLSIGKVVTAGNGLAVSVHESDTGTVKSKRFALVRPSDAVEQNTGELHLVFLA
jgi:hypothetical protein